MVPASLRDLPEASVLTKTGWMEYGGHCVSRSAAAVEALLSDDSREPDVGRGAGDVGDGDASLARYGMDGWPLEDRRPVDVSVVRTAKSNAAADYLFADVLASH